MPTRRHIPLLALALTAALAFAPGAARADLNNCHGGTAKPASGSRATGGFIRCVTSRPQVCARRGSHCWWRARATVGEIPVNLAVVGLFGSQGRRVDGHVGFFAPPPPGGSDHCHADGRGPIEEICTAEAWRRGDYGDFASAICRATAGPWANPAIPDEERGHIVIEQCEIEMFYCPNTPGARASRSRPGKSCHVARRWPRHRPGPCGVGVTLEGASATAADGRSLGWGAGRVSLRGRPDLVVGRTRVDRGQFSGLRCFREVALTATPDPGSRFDHWAGPCRVIETVCYLQPQPDGDDDVEAVFRPALWTVTVANAHPELGEAQGEGINCGDSGTYHHTACQAVVRETRDEDDRYQLDVYANGYRTMRPTIQSVDGCDELTPFNSAHVRCFLDVASDRTVTVTFAPG